MRKLLLTSAMSFALVLSGAAIAADAKDMKTPCAKGQVAMVVTGQASGHKATVCALNKTQAQKLHKASGTEAFNVACLWNPIGCD